MEAGAAPRRSARGDRYGRERCRALDIAARIVFGVSVMDRQIEEYLVAMGAARSGIEKREERVRAVRRMSLSMRLERIGEHISDVDVGALQERVEGIREVRNALAHSTLDVNARGSVGLDPKMKEYRTESLAATLGETESCNALREIFEAAIMGRDAMGGEA